VNRNFNRVDTLKSRSCPTEKKRVETQKNTSPSERRGKKKHRQVGNRNVRGGEGPRGKHRYALFEKKRNTMNVGVSKGRLQRRDWVSLSSY